MDTLQRHYLYNISHLFLSIRSCYIISPITYIISLFYFILSEFRASAKHIPIYLERGHSVGEE